MKRAFNIILGTLSSSLIMAVGVLGIVFAEGWQQVLSVFVLAAGAFFAIAVDDYAREKLK